MKFFRFLILLAYIVLPGVLLYAQENERQLHLTDSVEYSLRKADNEVVEEIIKTLYHKQPAARLKYIIHSGVGIVKKERRVELRCDIEQISLKGTATYRRFDLTGEAMPDSLSYRLRVFEKDRLLLKRSFSLPIENGKAPAAYLTLADSTLALAALIIEIDSIHFDFLSNRQLVKKVELINAYYQAGKELKALGEELEMIFPAPLPQDALAEYNRILKFSEKFESLEEQVFWQQLPLSTTDPMRLSSQLNSMRRQLDFKLNSLTLLKNNLHQAYLSSARESYSSGNLEQTESFLAKSLELNPAFGLAYILSAELKTNKDDNIGALEDLLEAFYSGAEVATEQLAKINIDILLGQADQLKNSGKSEEALEKISVAHAYAQRFRLEDKAEETRDRLKKMILFRYNELITQVNKQIQTSDKRAALKTAVKAEIFASRYTEFLDDDRHLSHIRDLLPELRQEVEGEVQILWKDASQQQKSKSYKPAFDRGLLSFYLNAHLLKADTLNPKASLVKLQKEQVKVLPVMALQYTQSLNRQEDLEKILVAVKDMGYIKTNFPAFEVNDEAVQNYLDQILWAGLKNKGKYYEEKQSYRAALHFYDSAQNYAQERKMKGGEEVKDLKTKMANKLLQQELKGMEGENIYAQKKLYDEMKQLAGTYQLDTNSSFQSALDAFKNNYCLRVNKIHIVNVRQERELYEQNEYRKAKTHFEQTGKITEDFEECIHDSASHQSLRNKIMAVNYFLDLGDSLQMMEKDSNYYMAVEYYNRSVNYFAGNSLESVLPTLKPQEASSYFQGKNDSLYLLHAYRYYYEHGQLQTSLDILKELIKRKMPDNITDPLQWELGEAFLRNDLNKSGNILSSKSDVRTRAEVYAGDLDKEMGIFKKSYLKSWKRLK